MSTTSSIPKAIAVAPAGAPAQPVIKHGIAMAGIAALGVVAYLMLTNLTGQIGQVCVLVVVWTIAVTGLNIVQGLGGYLSLAQAAFMGGGAYVSTILLNGGMPIMLAAMLAVLLVAIGGLIVGLVFSRTRGQYFAIGTLFFAAVATLVMNNWVEVTGGPNGLPVDLGFNPDTSLLLLAISLSAGFAAFYVIRRSRLGSRLLSIQEDEDLAAHLGVPTARAKLVALVLSAIFGAWAGVLLAQYNGVISPPQFTYGQGFLMFVAIGLAGYGRLLSPLIGSVIVLGLPQLLDLGPGVSQIVVGVIFVVVMLLVPGGILGGLDNLFRRVIRRRSQAEGESAS